jgi:polyhydroxybutyrate depolymerase
MRLWSRSALCLLLCACAPSKGEPEADTGGEGTGGEPHADEGGGHATGRHTLDHGGLERTFLLHVPDDLPPGAPLLLAFHGYSSDALTLRSYAGFDAIADREGFAVAYPLGTVDGWGYRYFEVGYAFHDGSVDDVGFARALAGALVADLGLDPDRVYATGMSNGGDLSYRLACEADDLVAGIAPVAGAMMGSLLQTCAPARAVPVLEIHGTDDDVTLWAGDPEDAGGWGAYPGTEEIMAFWAERHGAATEASQDRPDADPADGSTVHERSWTGAGADARVTLLEVRGGGHDWPGAWGNMDIDASEEIWAFLAGAR